MIRVCSVTLALLVLLALVACSPAGEARRDAVLARPSGQLFCRLQTSGGGAIVAAVVAVAVSGAAPAAAPLAVVVTGASKAAIDDDCAKAARARGAVAGVPAAAPVGANTVPLVAIAAPASPVVAVAPAVVVMPVPAKAR